MKLFDLSKGAAYTVVQEIKDFEGHAIPRGQNLTFLSQSFDLATGYYLLLFRERKLWLREDAALQMIERQSDYLAPSDAPPMDDEPRLGMCCPNCKTPMTRRPVTLFYQPDQVEIEVCMTCNVLWFDRSECIGMTARSVLDLFQYLNKARATPRMALSKDIPCPMCRTWLEKTQDMQRATRFSYWRCPVKHGELYTFTQFLLNKNFIRSPSPDDIARLLKIVRQVTCSQCGAPVDLVKDTVCSHCGTAITLVDPEGIAKAVKELEASEAKRASGASEAQMRAALIMAQNESLAKKYTDQDVPQDLLTAAVSAIATFLAR
jgi:Zn-finger nucleic acid-binding protein